MKWYTRAAERGYGRAQYNLALMYCDGEGVPKNNVYAYMWFNIAASQGDKLSVKNRDRVAILMIRSQIEKAQELAAECGKKKFKGCD